MESKTGAQPKETLWWRWTHGKSGSVSSSSHSAPYEAHNSNSSSKSASPSGSLRWQKRATRTPKEEANVAWSTSPSASSTSAIFFSNAATSRSVKGANPKKKAATSTRSRDAAKKALASSTFVFSSKEDKRAADISWSMGKSKRLATRKDRKTGKSSVLSSRSGARGRTHFLPDVKEDAVMKAPDNGSSVFSFSTQAKPARSADRSAFSFSLPQEKSGAKSETTAAAFAFDASFSRNKPAFPPTSPSAASTTSTASSFSSQSFSTVDPLVNCARAVLQDCIMKRKMEQSNARKRSIEGIDGDLLESKEFGWHFDVSKPRNYSMSSGSSSSSDDELSQLSSLDQSFCNEKPERGCDSKLAKEELYRQIMVGDYDLSSSPEYQCYSPLFEEKGLPIEIRYQLPLALGTANETSKECTICQLGYGIGDHIVTLPCQHFFHACCVDKWLWNHTSCPLCRTEVSLDLETEAPSTKHNFTECSPVDQERIRRQMRSSSQHAGFRPVVPVEVDQLELDVSRMVIDEDSDAEEEPSYLVCPTPHLATNLQDSSPAN